MTIFERVALAVSLAILLATDVPAVAQPYPNKPVKVVVSHAAGSSPDVRDSPPIAWGNVSIRPSSSRTRSARMAVLRSML
jgi:hypothetical protein